MSNPFIIWALVSFGLAAALFFIELFIPSGGLLGIGAAAALIVGVALLFLVDTKVGLLGAIVVLCCVPVGVGVAVTIWPNTPVAHFITLRSRQQASLAQLPAGHPDAPTPQELPGVGTVGQALTELRPVGTCIFQGQRISCLAATGLIPAGTRVKVVEVDGIEVKVREA